MSVLLSTLRKDAHFFNRYFQHVKGNLNFLKAIQRWEKR